MFSKFYFRFNLNIIPPLKHAIIKIVSALFIPVWNHNILSGICFYIFIVLLFMYSLSLFLLVPRPHLQFEAQLVAGKSHDFGPVSCPELPDSPAALSGIAFGKQKHDAELKYPQRIRRLNIFPASKTEVNFSSQWSI